MMSSVTILVLAASSVLSSPIIGVPVPSHEPIVVPEGKDSSRPTKDYSYLVVTTTGVPSTSAEGVSSVQSSTIPSLSKKTPLPDDIVPLDSAEERSRFLVTLLMLESLSEKPGATLRLKKELAADEEVMQEVLKLYETTQENKGKHFIKIPPKLMKKMRLKMKELMTE